MFRLTALLATLVTLLLGTFHKTSDASAATLKNLCLSAGMTINSEQTAETTTYRNISTLLDNAPFVTTATFKDQGFTYQVEIGVVKRAANYWRVATLVYNSDTPTNPILSKQTSIIFSSTTGRPLHPTRPRISARLKSKGTITLTLTNVKEGTSYKATSFSARRCT